MKAVRNQESGGVGVLKYDDAPKPFSPESALDILEAVTKTKPGYRRAHARGIVVRATFQATPIAKNLSSAEHFQGSPIPCLVRFSNSSGNPCAPDRTSPTVGKVLGMAIRFDLPSGAAATWAGINIPVFPVRTPQEFIALTEVQKPGKSGKPNLLRLAWHILKHIHILVGVKTIRGLKPTINFGTQSYFGLHTYYGVNAKGERKPFRYQWIPRLGQVAMNPIEAQALPELYLIKNFREQLEKGSVAWELIAQFPDPEDLLNDASVKWPKERKTHSIGTLLLDRVHEDQRRTEALVFDPTGIVPGLEISEDPILKFRSKIYGVSFDRRSKETRSEPAPTDMGQ